MPTAPSRDDLMINLMASPRLQPGLLGRHSLPPHCGDGRVNWCRSWAAGVGAGSGVAWGSLRERLSPRNPTMASSPSNVVRTDSMSITSSMCSIAGCGPSPAHVKTTACPACMPCLFESRICTARQRSFRSRVQGTRKSRPGAAGYETPL